MIDYFKKSMIALIWQGLEMIFWLFSEASFPIRPKNHFSTKRVSSYLLNYEDLVQDYKWK